MPIASDLPTVGFLVLVCVLMPYSAWQGYFELKRGKPLPPKLKRFRLMVIGLLMIIVWAFMAADINNIRLSYKITPLFALLAIATSALLLKAVRGWRKADAAGRERTLMLYGAEDRAQLRWLLATAVCAGVGEEIIYRGVLFALVTRLTGSVLLGMAISIVFFALAHVAQGFKSTILAGLFGLMFHLFCLLTGSLAAAMIVHTIYDGGLFIRFYRELKLLRVAQVNDAVESAKTASI